MKKTLRIAALICVFMLSITALIACGPNEDTIINGIKHENISVSIAAKQDKITIDLSSKESEVGTSTAKIFGVGAYEYFEQDVLKGLSGNIVSANDDSKVVGEYKLGTDATIEFDRYTDGCDALYNKYYIVANNKLLKGPLYATDIEAKSEVKPNWNIKSKKGVLGENVDYFKDLGCSYTAINFDVAKLIYPNEMFDGDDVIELAHPDGAYEFTSNGKKYYFNRSVVDQFDREVSKYYNAGAHITAILYAQNSITQESFPEKMTYMPYATMPTQNVLGVTYTPRLVGLNTSNEYGFQYVIAMMEFLAERYTQDGLGKGFVANFVIGNEVDYARDYNKISKNQAEFDVYMEEYSRLLRLCNLSLKKYHKDITVCVPFTQAWAEPGFNIIDNSVSCYTPKKMADWLNTKSKLEGDYDWGIAPHCYTYGLASSNIFYNDTYYGVNIGMTNDYETSSKLTFTNLEILDNYLNRDEMKVNGNVRSVYLTESGMSTWDDKNNKDYHRNNQAGAIAASWYKISQMDCIKAFNYYRMIDHESEVKAFISFGLLDSKLQPKPSYEVYKYIDTQYSQYVADKYLKYNVFAGENGVQIVPDSYEVLMDLFNTGWFDGKTFDWSKIAPVTAETVYEWEDKEDLSAVVFDSANYLYDGTEKRISVLNVPQGLEVSYNVDPTLTEIGSKEVIATFTRDGEVVGRRKATISIAKISTDKTVYNYGEKVFVTVDPSNLELTPHAWVGIYRKGAEPGNLAGGEMSYYYFYASNLADSFTRTFCLQDHPNEAVKADALPEGNYVIYWFDTDEYHVYCSLEITVLPQGKDREGVDLSGVKFESKAFAYTGSEQTLTVTGELPKDVTVEYINNTLAQAGSVQAIAVFKYKGEEIARRYAVLTVMSEDFEYIRTNKTKYLVGETVYVTAYAPEDSQPKTWWVGLCPDGKEISESFPAVYWYYVNDDYHRSGETYDIKTCNITPGSDSYNIYGSLPAGKYKMVLFNTSGYTVETAAEFEVVAIDFGDDKGSVTADKEQYNLNDPINVTATAPQSDEYTFFVGLIKATSALTAENIIYYYGLADGTHISGQTYDITKETLNPSMSAELTVGKYKVVLYTVVNEQLVLANEMQIQIGSDEEQPTVGTIKTDKTSYAYGEDIMVTANVSDDTVYWWVGWYLASVTEYNNSPSNYSLAWYEVDRTEIRSGIAYNLRTIDLQYNVGGNNYSDFPVGKYKMVLFETSGYEVRDVAEFEIVLGFDVKADVSTEKTEYGFDDPINVTATQEADSDRQYYVGLLKANAKLTAENIIYSYQIVDDNHVSGETYNLRDQLRNSALPQDYTLEDGKYSLVLYVVIDGEFVSVKTVEITVKPEEGRPDPISSDKQKYALGDDVMITGNLLGKATYGWIGLFNSDYVAGQAVTSLTYYYVGEGKDAADGEAFNLKSKYVCAVGSYKAVLFKDDGYEVLGEITFEVELGVTSDASISTDKTEYEFSDPINVTATIDEGDTLEYYVGLINKTDPVESSKVIYSYKAVDGNHVSGTAYNLREQTLNSALGADYELSAGQYVAVLYVINNGTLVPVDQAEIAIKRSEDDPAPSGPIYSDKTQYKVGETVMVTATAPEDSADSTWWVGLYLQGDNYNGVDKSIWWYYVKDASHVSGTAYNIRTGSLGGGHSDHQTIPAGNYILVLYNTSGYSVETTYSFTVVE